MKNNKFNVDDEVYWTDPDNGFSSGYYNVVDVIHDDCGEDNIYYIKDEHSEAEVFEHELS